MVKKLLAMQEIWVRSFCWKDPLEKGMVTHSSILGAGDGQGGLACCSSWDSKESDMTE